MKRKRLLVFSLMVLISLLTGCLQLKIKPGIFPRLENLEEEFLMGNYVPKVDNFFIILDASSSMSVAYQGDGYGDESKFKIAKDFIKRMNNTMPEMNINGALQTFGHGIAKPMRQTETVYGIATHTKLDLEESLNNVSFPAEGNSPAGLAIRATRGIIKNTKGKNAIILISDGENLEDSPQMRVRVLNERYGDRTCFYTVWIGNDPKGKSFMESLAGDMGCGFATSIGKITSDRDMIDFVKQVFLTSDRDSDGDGVVDSIDRCPDTPIGVEVDEYGCPKVINTDSDGDGVYDDKDDCPDTPIGVEVDEFGCPITKRMDSDGDGVYDDKDNCPNTPLGVEVDEYGCPKINNTDSDGDGVFDDRDECPDTPKDAIVDNRGCWVVKGVQFDYKKWDVKPQFNSNLDNVENILKKNPELTIRIEGHTDDIGSMEYNLNLSSKRAQSIKDYLLGKGIDEWRITTIGLGFTQPIADNDTPEGRALNRRAEIVSVK
ncbi:MAG: OmpA family protein [Planctomycetota bacterium]|jgi:OOP family OmpA-OmpF porin